jgi:2-polyprenyl-3-methyl-5-hydroxy-6-metoxy-1,4-benzoquinol methylase
VNSRLKIKNSLARHAPNILKTLQEIHFLYLYHRGSRAAFTQMYQKNGWFVAESTSGPGSTLGATEPIRAMLPRIIHELNIHSLLDAGCGDFNWMKEVDLPEVKYTGVDVVDRIIIERNIAAYGSASRHFMVADVTRDALPKVDLIFCRHCLPHLPNNLVQRALRQFKHSGSTYLMTTTFPELRRNQDTFTGGFRPLNLQLPPFQLPAPLMMIEDGGDNNADAGFLGMWNLREMA